MGVQCTSRIQGAVQMKKRDERGEMKEAGVESGEESGRGPKRASGGQTTSVRKQTVEGGERGKRESEYT